jgi:hypothetical protein
MRFNFRLSEPVSFALCTISHASIWFGATGRPNHKKGNTTLPTNSQQVRERAEANFKKKEIQMRESRKALVEYNAAGLAVFEKTARLRALRLARDAAEVARVKIKPINLPANKPVLSTKKRSNNPSSGDLGKV